MNPTDHRLIYLASPYTDYPLSRTKAFSDVAALAGELALQGYSILPPVLIGHPMAWHGRAPAVDHDFWARVNRPYMEVCDALLICMMDGWKRSKGIWQERLAFATMGKPEYFLNPDGMRISKRERV